MTITPDDLRKEAYDRFQDANGLEVRYRTVAGRAYYAAFIENISFFASIDTSSTGNL